MQEMAVTRTDTGVIMYVTNQLFNRTKGSISERANRVPKCDVIILQILPFEPLNLIMRYAQQL